MITQRTSAQLNLLSHLQLILSRRPKHTIWATFYTGLQNTVVFDDGSQFRDTFVEICKINDIERQRSGMQHRSAT